MNKRIGKVIEKIKRTSAIKKALFFVVLLLIFSTIVYAQVTFFNNNVNRVGFLFQQEYTTKSFFIRVPNGTITEARMRIQGFTTTGQKGVPADVILVTDTSGSMDDNCPGGSANPGETPCKINDAKAADISFLDNVNLNYIHVGLAHYYTTAALDQQLTNNRATLVQRINAYAANGWTAMGRGMQLAMTELLSTRAQSPPRKYMLVMTDGWANCIQSGSCGDSYGSGGQAAAYVTSIAQQCAQNNIVIFGISFGECGSDYSDQSTADCDLMDQISGITGGQSFNAPDAQTLQDIYNQIAQMIDVQDFPTPIISSTSPASITGWSYPIPFSGNSLWNLNSCGDPSASCSDFRSLVQQNLAVCSTDPCDIQFSVYSSTVGMLNLSDLYIEINVPPEGNYPPIGNCRFELITCPQTQREVNMDDGTMVSDANDALNTLTWTYDYSIESTGGSYFILNSDYNSLRRLAFTTDPAYLNQNYWRTFFFNISDPWEASTMSCINVSYQSCAPIICGNGPPRELGEECERNNTFNNTYCSQTPINCSDAPRLRTRDLLGDCNAVCACVNDSWSEPVCNATRCGATCNEGANRTCFVGPNPGIQYCNSTTCIWDPCTPLGFCSDGTRNTPSEDCDYPPFQNNPDCHQDNESCIGLKLETRLDLLGDCNVTCQCNNNTWNTPTCTAGYCGANCTAGANLPCTTPGGYPGNQACNSTTCDWNACTTNLYCGDNKVNGTETCEPPNINNAVCSQSTQSCSGLQTLTRDTFGYCNATCGCEYDTWSAACDITGNCGAVCDATTPSQYCNGGLGIRYCDLTACDWGACTPLGYCGDGTRNQLAEQCEPNDNQKNPAYCLQENESCIGARIRTRTDMIGSCNAECLCYDDIWSALTCMAGKCGAICNANDTQDCDLGGGVRGIQTCNINTCQWNSCTPLGVCGDGTRNQATEECEPRNNQDNQFCSQENESCVGLKFSTRFDVLGDCNNACQCGYDSWNTPTCTAGRCGAICSEGQTPQPCTIYGLAGTRSCNPNTCDWGNCIPNPINCVSPAPSYLLGRGETINIPLSDIFDGDTSTAVSISHPHSSALSISDSLPNMISVTANGVTSETVKMRIATSYGGDSDSCPVDFLSLSPNCEKSGCDTCGTDLTCLETKQCLDGSAIMVLTPFTPFRPAENFPPGLPNLNYVVDSFVASDYFKANQSTTDSRQLFVYDGSPVQYMPHGTRGAAVISLHFPDYSLTSTKLCVELIRMHYVVGDVTYDPITDLLITGARAVTGYYENYGFVFSKGPYIFIAKVWLRE